MRKELKEKIKNAFAGETPDLGDRIISACEKETQLSEYKESAKNKKSQKTLVLRRLAAVAACLALFVSGLFAGYMIPENQPAASVETLVYLDVNPSLELSLDEYNRVVSCTAINDDAKNVLSEMNLEGVELKTALNAIVGSMYVKGYLNKTDNSMLISVDTKDSDNTNGFLSYITDKVNEVFSDSDMECSIIAQGVKADEDLKHRAEKQGVSVGKMHLLDKMVDSMDEFDENSISYLSGMSIKELNLIYSEKPDKDNKPKPDDELIYGNVGGYVDKDEALNAVLAALGVTVDDVEKYNILVLPDHHADIQIFYAVTLKLKNDNTLYKYKVNCETGEAFPGGFDDKGPGNTAPPSDDSQKGNEFPPDKDFGQNGEFDGIFQKN
ncbi:MAG: hypothetical protein ACI3XS_03635 [Eubacteriales bacterium]